MIYTVFRDNSYDGWELLGEYDEETLDTLTSTGFYCKEWSQFLKYKRYDLIIVEGRVID